MPKKKDKAKEKEIYLRKSWKQRYIYLYLHNIYISCVQFCDTVSDKIELFCND